MIRVALWSVRPLRTGLSEDRQAKVLPVRDPMGGLQRLLAKIDTARELLSFFGRMRRWWLTPLVLILVLFGLFLLVAQGSALAPVLYALF